MKIRIVQAGYETFTGLLGDVKFEDGVSVKDVSAEQFAYIRSMFVVEEVAEEVVESDGDTNPQGGEELTPEGQEEDQKPQERAELTSEGQNETAEGAAE